MAGLIATAPTFVTLAIASSLALALAASQSAVGQTPTVVDATNSPYTIPGGTITAGDTVRVVPGGSLDQNQGTVTNNGALEFAPTTAGGAIQLQNSLTGTGTVIKTGDGTVNNISGGNGFAGNWRFEEGIIRAANSGSGGAGQSSAVFGTNSTWTFAGGFFQAKNDGDYSVVQKELIVTPDGGGIDFSQQVVASGFGTQTIEGNTGGSNLGITGGGTLDLSTSNIDSAVVGTSYQLFNFSGTPTGNFASLTPLGGIYSGITWTGPVGGVWTSTNGTGGNYLTFTEGTGTLAVVPVPSTLTLAVIAGHGGLAALRRRRRKA